MTEPVRYRDLESEFFFKKDAELIRQQHEKMAKEQEAEEEQALRELHRLKCPQCGHDMVEVRMGELVADRCGHCFGVFFEESQLELLHLEGQPKSFLTTLHGLLVGESDS